MSNLFDESSLAMIPTAYKDGKLYSVRPTPEYGAEEVTNGNFATDSNWTKGTGWTISGGTANCNGTNDTAIEQNISSSNTTLKRITFSVSNYVSGTLRVYSGSGADVFLNVTANGTYELESYLIANKIFIYSLSSFVGSVDNVSVKEVIKTDGDFTFSRGSNLAATRVNSSQLIEKGRENIILQSNQFDTTWATSSASVTSGQSGYDGSSDAWLLESASAGGSYVVQNVSTSGVVSFSVYAKANTSNFLNLNLTGGTYFAWFDLSTGATGTINGASIDSSIESVGAGWYRCTIVTEGSNTSFRIYLTDANGSTSSAAGNSIYIQDAQLESGLVATPYIETGASTAQAGILEDLPRLDYSDGASCPSLLLEPSRTNGIAQSEYFESWTQDGITTSSNTTDTLSPEGLYNASKITAVSGNKRIYVGSTHSAGVITGSCYVKAGTTDVVTLNASSFLITYNLTTLAVTETIGTGTITSVGNGWYRVTATSAVSASANRTPQIVINTASAGEYLYIYGAMIGVSPSETSYIPTYGTSASRAVDSMETETLDSLTTYSLLVDIKNLKDIGGSVTFIDKKASSSGYGRIFLKNGSDISYYSSSTGYLGNVLSLSNGAQHKYLLRVTNGFIEEFFDGVKQTSTGTNSSDLFTGIELPSAPAQLNLNQLLVFPTALSDVECIALTTI